MNSPASKRSLRQNNSGHKFWTDIADTLNEAGIDQRILLEETAYNLPNTMESIKFLVQRMSKEMYGEEHTSKLTTKQFKDVNDVLAREIGQIFGVDIPEYPSENLLDIKRRIDNGEYGE